MKNLVEALESVPEDMPYHDLMLVAAGEIKRLRRVLAHYTNAIEDTSARNDADCF